jgi:hypothetical protein
MKPLCYAAASLLGLALALPAVAQVRQDVSLSTPQTITGKKTFTAAPTNGEALEIAPSSMANNDAALRISLPSSSIATAYGYSVAGAIAGDLVAELSNTNNGAGTYDTKSTLAVGGTSAGDPFHLYSIPSGTSWSVGVDNSHADRFKIQPTTALSTSAPSFDFLPTGNLLVRPSTIGNGGVGIQVEIPSETAATEYPLYLSGAVQGDLVLYFTNTSNTAGSDALYTVASGGSSAGDAATIYSVSGVTDWSVGVDNDDSDRFKACPNYGLSTSAACLSSDTSGNWSAGISISTGAVAVGTCNAAAEGQLIRSSATGGTGTTARTRVCLCTSDGAASPAYAWQNVVTGTVGTSSACNL